jgi:hypothetical protein
MRSTFFSLHYHLVFVDESRELLNAAGIEFHEKYCCEVWHPSGVRSLLTTFPVVSADSDHRLLSLQPFGLLTPI